MRAKYTENVFKTLLNELFNILNNMDKSRRRGHNKT